mmetsp:Transcript_285/g.373  ORF Transcript_285/g.373 Transcript_285/m.373 type:complete len:87 (+) Transcript_285:57-317(+)
MSFLQNVARRAVIGNRARATRMAQVQARSFSAPSVEEPQELTKDGAIVVDNVSFTLEWVLSSPPPLHAFEEPPIMVEWPEGEAGDH